MLRKRSRRESPVIAPKQVHAFADGLFGEDMHAARVGSLANAVTGVLSAGRLGIHAIGGGLASAKGLTEKHAIKQVDRLIGNEKLDPDAISVAWTRFRLAEVEDPAWVNLDWTEFDGDDHSILVLSLQGSGRATPLVWKTVQQSKLKGERNNAEDTLMARFAEAVPDGVEVVIVADRGFCDQRLFSWLPEELDFDFIIRVRSDIHVTDAKGTRKLAREWVGKGGRMRRIKGARITRDETLLGAFVAVQDKGMKDAWCLVVSRADWSGSEVKKRYGKRFTCEETSGTSKTCGSAWE